MAAPVCIPNNSVLAFPFLYNVTQNLFFDLLMMAIITCVGWYLIVALICISLMASDVGHPFICLWALVSSLDKYLFRSFAHLFVLFIRFLL